MMHSAQQDHGLNGRIDVSVEVRRRGPRIDPTRVGHDAPDHGAGELCGRNLVEVVG